MAPILSVSRGDAAAPDPGGQVNPFLRAVRAPLMWLIGYLAVIALSPVPVDSGPDSFLRDITRIIPVLTYTRIEVAANVVLFAPLGLLLWRMLRQRVLVLPMAIVARVVIEGLADEKSRTKSHG